LVFKKLFSSYWISCYITREDLGFKGITNLTAAMLGIHRYAYNGLDKDISPFHGRNDALILIKELIETEI